jgi:addiction module RelE/StbE family toxin
MALRSYQVIWMPVAVGDLAAIQDYISEDNPRAALEVVEALSARAASLHLCPGRGRLVPELLGQGGSSYREVICPPWRIVYRVHGNKVLVFGVLDGRRQLHEILAARKARYRGTTP